MMYSLWLRAALLKINYEHYLPQIREWGNLVGNIQLYDDLKDIKADWDYQPNYPIILSFECFPEEYSWFQENMEHFEGCGSGNEIIELCIAMPKTVCHTLMLSKSMGICQLGWFTKFAANYCWNQNWTNTFLCIKAFRKSQEFNLMKHSLFAGYPKMIHTPCEAVNLVFLLIAKTHSLFDMLENKDFYFDYLLMLCLYDRNFNTRFYTQTNIVHSYKLMFRFQFMKTGFRSHLLSLFVKRRKAALISAVHQYQLLETTDEKSFSPGLLKHIRDNWI